MGGPFLLKEVNRVLTKKKKQQKKKEAISHSESLAWSREIAQVGMWNAKSQGKVHVKLSRNVSWPVDNVAKLQAAWRARLLFFWCSRSEEASGRKRNSQDDTVPCSKINTEIENHRNTLWKAWITYPMKCDLIFFFFPKSLPVMACWSKGEGGFWSPAGLTTCINI